MTGRKLPRSTRTDFLYKALEASSTLPSGENRTVCVSAFAHQEQIHDTVVYFFEVGPRKFDEVDFDAVGAEVVKQRFDELVW